MCRCSSAAVWAQGSVPAKQTPPQPGTALPMEEPPVISQLKLLIKTSSPVVGKEERIRLDVPLEGD